jgi:protein TonB
LLWCLVLAFSGIVGAFVALGPNPGPQVLQVIEIDMDSGPSRSTRNIPRPRHRQEQLKPVDAQPVKAAAAPPVKHTVEHTDPDVGTVESLSQVENVEVPSADTSLAGVSTSAAAAAAGFMTRKDFLQLVKMRIEAMKTYPDQARKRNQQGVVVIEFELEKGGRIRAANVRKSSGVDLLDQAAVQAVQKAAPFPRAPEGLFAYPVRLRVGVAFELT